MNDRELLEMAAKAFGFGAQNPPDNHHGWTQSEYPKRSGRHGALWNYVGHGETAELWNPLSDDGDALRLAVKLGIELIFTKNKIGAGRGNLSIYPWVNEDRNVGDPYAATRRAIVRAAAEIGRNQP